MAVRLLPCDVRNALQLCEQHGIYAYDAYFLASAQRLACPLVTLDQRMRQVAAEMGITLMESDQ